MSTLGQVIRARRIEMDLTQEELAERIGGSVRQAEISRLEHDRIVLPRRDRLEAIAQALDLPLGRLLASSGWTGAEGELPPFEGPENSNMTLDLDAEAIPVVKDMLNQVKVLVEQVEALVDPSDGVEPNDVNRSGELANSLRP